MRSSMYICIIILIFLVIIYFNNMTIMEKYDNNIFQKQLLGSSIVRSIQTVNNNIGDLTHIEPNNIVEPEIYTGTEMKNNFTDEQSILQSLCVAILKNTVYETKQKINDAEINNIVDDIMNDENLIMLEDDIKNYDEIIEYIINMINKINKNTITININKINEFKCFKYNDKKLIIITLLLNVEHPNNMDKQNIETKLNIKLLMSFNPLTIKIRDLIIY